MIDAGVEQLWLYDPAVEADSTRAIRIYQAMRRLEPRNADRRQISCL